MFRFLPGCPVRPSFFAKDPGGTLVFVGVRGRHFEKMIEKRIN